MSFFLSSNELHVLIVRYRTPVIPLCSYSNHGIILQELKAVIPPPVLKTCLESMSVVNESNEPQSDSDNEDADDDGDDDFVSKKGKKKSKKKKSSSSTTIATASVSSASANGQQELQEQYSKSVRVKLGRNANTTLYYLNQSKLGNDGNGILPEDKNDLVCSNEKAKAELEALNLSCKQMTAETSTLLSEPKNEEIETLLREKENELNGIRNDVAAAKKFSGNAASSKTLKRAVDKMATHWRQHKRKCLDFLDMMEECTEGVINKKKCLSGSGQIDIETDEAVAKQAKEMHQHRMSSKNRGLKKRASSTGSNKEGESVEASESFVAVMLGPGATIMHVTAD